MGLALGLVVHTGWTAAVVAGGDWDKPLVALRERVEVLGAKERFVFHKAEGMPMSDARAWVANATRTATENATSAVKRVIAAHDVQVCAVVAKKTVMPPLEEVVASHPRIHTAEGCFYRDVMKAAAEACGIRTTVIAASELDAKDERLSPVGRLVGKPWSVDWKLAVLAAWHVL